MASGDRVQIILEAKDEMSDEIGRARKALRGLESQQAKYEREVKDGNADAAQSYERVRREIQEQNQGIERLKAEHRLLAREARKAADEEARAALKSRAATKRQEMAVERVTGKMDALGRRLGVSGRSWDRLTAKAGDFSRRWSRSIDDVGDEMDRHDRRGRKMLSGWGLAATGAVAAVAGAVAGIASSLGLIGDAINEARGARKALSQTGAVIRSMGRTESPKAVERLINQLERASGIDGDNLREMTNVLFTFGNVTGDTFMKANELALDLSAAFGKDLQSSAVMVGKALNDPLKGLTALSRVGVSFTKQQQEQVKAMMAVGDLAGAQGVIMGELTKQVAGSAAAQADSIDRSTVAWGNLKEAVGDVLLDTSTGVGLTKGLEDATKWVKQHKRNIISVLQAIMSAVFKWISVWLKWISISVKGLGYIVGGIASLLQSMAWLDPSMQGAADKARGLADGFGKASAAADRSSKYFDDLARKSGLASKKTQALADALRNVKSPKKIRFVIETVVNGFTDLGNIGAPVDNNFAGGPIDAGTRSWVGELGPELFVPRFGEPVMVGERGPEIRDFDQSGFIVPNHLVAAATQTVTRERVVERGGAPSLQVGSIQVRDDREVVREMERMLARQARLDRERR